MPVLAQVGDDWHRGRTRIAHEHLMSSTMRNLLGAFLRLYARRETSVRLLFATPSGERHEIATLGAAMLAASAGLGVSYLGADLPAREIVDSVEPAGAQVLVLGVTTAAADEGACAGAGAASCAAARPAEASSSAPIRIIVLVRIASSCLT